VRYGAAMALGVACAGTGGREALELLGGMAADSAECVRQGALIGQALVLVGSIPQTADSRAGTLRKVGRPGDAIGPELRDALGSGCDCSSVRPALRI
jgi:hypothetical protein